MAFKLTNLLNPLYDVKAAGNIAKRVGEVGAGNLFNQGVAKYVFEPQSAYAADTQNKIDTLMKDNPSGYTLGFTQAQPGNALLPLNPDGSIKGAPAQVQPTASTNQTQTTATATGSGGTAKTPNVVEYPSGSGFYYNLDDPGQRESFFNAKLTDLNSSHTSALNTIAQNIAALQKQASDYVGTYKQNIDAFNQAKQGGDISRINAFSQASPDAFQSSQVDSYNVGNNAYLKGLAGAANQANTDVGGDFLANPTDYTKLASGSAFGQQLGAQNQNINDVNNQFNTSLAGINQQNNASTSPYKFIYQAAKQSVPSPVSLTGNTPAVNFTSAPAPQTPTNAFSAIGGSAPIGAGANLSPFIGSGNNLNPTDLSSLHNYLLGNAS